MILNLFITNEFNVIKIYEMSQRSLNELELLRLPRNEIQVPSSRKVFLNQLKNLVQLFLFFHFMLHIYSKGYFNLNSGN